MAEATGLNSKGVENQLVQPTGFRPWAGWAMERWHKPQGVRLHFLTGNVYGRIPVFGQPEFCSIFLDSLDYCRRKYQLQVYGFVIMPDHFHLLVGVPRDGVLSNFLRDWKGFTAHSLVERMQERGKRVWLKKFHTGPSQRRRDARFHIFQADTHVEGIFSKHFVKQKLDYIHKNPVVAGLAQREVDYPYSSARNWFLNDQSIFRVDELAL